MRGLDKTERFYSLFINSIANSIFLCNPHASLNAFRRQTTGFFTAKTPPSVSPNPLVGVIVLFETRVGVLRYRSSQVETWDGYSVADCASPSIMSWRKSRMREVLVAFLDTLSLDSFDLSIRVFLCIGFT
ncbi:hypothetical protein AYI69_g9690 [Smittium culicis]|uniref:Uncharacterized protein n=1 Tax=Smittium culicis TaxID=133412 RepID=A0A1R1XB35_9FUNG|nr:hypothetical protein AYI69_g9690 [Smittium culicis]